MSFAESGGGCGCGELWVVQTFNSIQLLALGSNKKNKEKKKNQGKAECVLLQISLAPPQEHHPILNKCGIITRHLVRNSRAPAPRSVEEREVGGLVCWGRYFRVLW